MANIHIAIQGKGGIGKSFQSYLLAQRLNELHTSLLCIDTDPTNDTLNQFIGLKTERVIITENNIIQQKLFEQLLDRLWKADEEAIVIDVGSSNFLQMVDYMSTQNFLKNASRLGHTVHLHMLVAGGKDLNETWSRATWLVDEFKTLPKPPHFYLWLNPFYGSLVSRQAVPLTEHKDFAALTRDLTGWGVMPFSEPAKNAVALETIDKVVKNKALITDAMLDEGSYSISERFTLEDVWSAYRVFFDLLLKQSGE